MTAEHQPSRAKASHYKLEIVKNDPFARQLQAVNLGPLQFGLLVALFGILRNLILPAVFGNLHTVQTTTGQTVLGVLQDWPVLVNELIMVPVIAAYYLWQPSTMQTLYDGISSRIGSSHLSRAHSMEFVRPVRWPGWSIVALLIALLETAYILFILLRDDVHIWQTANPLMIFLGALIRLVTFYMLVFVIVRQVFTILGLNRLFTEIPIKIAPLHPDRAGGLRILGEYVLSTGLIVAAVGLYFGMGIVRRSINPIMITTEFYILMTIYFLLAPLFFFLPLIQVHRRMKEAKKRLLIEAAEQFDIEYHRLLEGLKHEQLATDNILRVEAAQKVYKIAEEAPEWPFNLEILSKFGAAVIFPVLVPGIMQVVGNWLFP